MGSYPYRLHQLLGNDSPVLTWHNQVERQESQLLGRRRRAEGGPVRNPGRREERSEDPVTATGSRRRLHHRPRSQHPGRQPDRERRGVLRRGERARELSPWGRASRDAPSHVMLRH